MQQPAGMRTWLYVEALYSSLWGPLSERFMAMCSSRREEKAALQSRLQSTVPDQDIPSVNDVLAQMSACPSYGKVWRGIATHSLCGNVKEA